MTDNETNAPLAQPEPEADDNFVKTVNELATRTHKSKAEVLRNAVNLYYKAVDEWERNKRSIVFQVAQPAVESEHFEWELLDEDGRQIACGHWPDLDSARQEGLDLLNTYLPEDRRRLVIRRHQAFVSVAESHML